jgi:hypothetical protein
LAGCGVKSVKLPPRSPNLNAYAERFVRTIKEGCVEQMIFLVKIPCATRLENSSRIIKANGTTKVSIIGSSFQAMHHHQDGKATNAPPTRWNVELLLSGGVNRVFGTSGDVCLPFIGKSI